MSERVSGEAESTVVTVVLDINNSQTSAPTEYSSSPQRPLLLNLIDAHQSLSLYSMLAQIVSSVASLENGSLGGAH